MQIRGRKNILKFGEILIVFGEIHGDLRIGTLQGAKAEMEPGVRARVTMELGWLTS